jgi:hypothetical protein
MSTDYTACSGKDCPIKEQCKRFTGPKEPLYQSYFAEIPGKWKMSFEPRNVENGYVTNEVIWNCDMFWGEAQDSIMNQLNEIMK